MDEKFRKVVASPEQLAKKLRQIIEKKNPSEYVRTRREQRDNAGITDKHAELQDNAAVIGLETAKWTAWLAAGGAQLLLTLVRWTTMDNVFLRKLENKLAIMNVGKNKNGELKKLSSFAKIAKKYPNVSAHILWLMGLGLVAGGAYVGTEILPDKIQQYKEWRADKLADKHAEEQARGTYRAFLNKMQPITPFLIADLIAKEGVHMEGGLHTPYRDSRDVPTIGFGSTMLKDGSRVTMDTPPITTEEAYELARWHLEEGETYFVLYCYDVAMDGVDVETTSEALGMSSIIYNSYSKLIEEPNDKNHRERFDKLRKLYAEYGYAVPDSLVRKCFEQYPVTKPTSVGRQWLKGANIDTTADKLGGFLAGGRGMYWRRWLEAGLLTGDITPQMLLQCPVNGMFEFFKVMGEEKSAFFTGDINNRQVNQRTFKLFRQWLAQPVNAQGQSLVGWKKVGDFLPADILAFCQNGECELNNKGFNNIRKSHEAIEVKTYTLGYDAQYNSAIAAYSEKNYDSAAAQFEKMVAQYPDNALLHNDLAATYNHLGRYTDAIAQAREILHRIGDKSQYAAAQYNAGFAYEQMGEYERALANYKLAVINGNARVQNDVNRLQKKIKSGKTIAFYDAVDMLNNANASGVSNTADVLKKSEHTV